MSKSTDKTQKGAVGKTQRAQEKAGKGSWRVSKALRVRVGEDGHLYGSLSKSSGEFYMAIEVLETLALLSETGTEENLAKRLRQRFLAALDSLPKGPELSAIVADLEGAGLLIHNTRETPRRLQQDGFGDSWAQWAMIADSWRTEAYIAALKRSISRQSVVLDIGSGTGLFSAAALSFGARSVLAIEETDAARYVRPILERLGLPAPGKSTFDLFLGNSADAPLPCEANLLVSELFGNDPFQEGVLPTLREICHRIGVWDGRAVTFIPTHFEVFAEVVDVVGSPVYGRIAALHARGVPGARQGSQEARAFYLRFREACRDRLAFLPLSFAYALGNEDYKKLSPSQKLGTVPLGPPSREPQPFAGNLTVRVEHAGSAPVVLLWFRVWLDSETSISSHPGEKDYGSHWSPLLIPLLEPVDIGEKLQLSYQLAEGEDTLKATVKIGNKCVGAR